MESPTIPDHRPYRMAIDEITNPTLKGSAQNSLRSNSPLAQAYEPQPFGQPAIGRPPMSPRQRSMPLNSHSRPNSSANVYPNGNENGNGTANGTGNGNGYSSEYPSRKPSIDQASVAESNATLDLGYHSIGRPQPPPRSEKRLSVGSKDFDQRSLGALSLDGQSVGNQSLGHHSIGGAPGAYYS